MKIFIIVFISILFVISGLSQSNLDFYSIILKVEENPYLSINAKNKAIERNLPISIFIADEVFAQPVIIENDDVLYSVITNIIHPFNGGYLATFNEIERTYDLNKAQIRYYGDKIKNNLKNTFQKIAPGDSLFLVCESTNDRVMAFDAHSGDLVDADFIPGSVNLGTPIEPLLSPWGTISISDQVVDLVQEFDTSGIFIRSHAPAGGVNLSILDNIRGIAYRPNDNLLVSVGGGSNIDAIAEFDSAGTYLGNFIAPNANILDSPWDILIRASDILIGGSSSDDINRYDTSGNYLDEFASNVPFPQQMVELRSGEIAVAQFGIPNTGIQIYPASGGAYTQLLVGVTGNRGIAELRNGNLLTTNGGGVYEVDRSTGNLVRTIITGPGNILSSRYISLFVVNQQPSLPLFNLSATSIDFGTVQKDSSKTDTLIVYNSGNAELLISSVISDNNDFVVIPDSGLIAINDSLLFEVTFTAGSDSGSQNGNLIFTHNSQSSPDSVYVMANVVTGLDRSEIFNPKTFRLSQNFPNPFNPSTNIKFSLPVAEYVELKIFNINGEEIESLVKKHMQAGEYNLNFNATSLPTGVYIYEIRAGNFKQSHKMILLK